jgi:hypothetical protein
MIEIGAPGLAAAAARMLEHAPHDAIATLAVLGDLLDIAAQQPHRLVDLRASAAIGIGNRPVRRPLQFVDEFHRKPSEVVDEAEISGRKGAYAEPALPKRLPRRLHT